MSEESLDFQKSSGTSGNDVSSSPFTFTASTNQVSHLADVFSSITSINSQALMIITTNGIIIYSEYNHICNVQLSIDPSLFGAYNFYSENNASSLQNNEELRLGIDIGLISDAFNAAASSSVSKSKTKTTANNANTITANGSVDNLVCYITYNGEGYPLVVEFEDSLMSEKIEFLTIYLDIAYPYDVSNSQEEEEDEQYNLVINHSEIQFEVILKSDVFTNLLKDLQQINTIDLFMYISNEMRHLGSKRQKSKKSRKSGPSYLDKQFNFISKGPIGHLKLIFPNEKTILEKLNIYGKDHDDSEMKPINTSLISCYNFGNFSKIFKAVKLSIKCKIMKDLSGILSIQLLCKNPQLTNYSGTLITFNMLESSTIVDKFDKNEEPEDFERFHLNNIFDDESYEYIKDYNDKNHKRVPVPDIESTNIREYEELGNEKDEPPILSYASFRNNSKLATSNNVQINETIYEEDKNGNNKKRKNEMESVKDNDKNIKTVGGAIEIPLFL